MPSANRKRKELFKLRSSIDQRKIKFVTNDGKSKEKSFLFRYHFKKFGTV